MKTSLSVVAPIYNEAQGLEEFIRAILTSLRGHESLEIIAVDDGSKDDSVKVLSSLAQRHPELKVIVLARNYGQTTAIAAGIKAAKGDIIVLIDSDLENDPADISKVIAPILK